MRGGVGSRKRILLPVGAADAIAERHLLLDQLASSLAAGFGFKLVWSMPARPEVLECMPVTRCGQAEFHLTIHLAATRVSIASDMRDPA